MTQDTSDHDRTCPICKEPLHHQLKERIPIESCPKHGVWMATGDFDRLVKKVMGRLKFGQRSRSERTREAGYSRGYYSTLFLSLFDGSADRRRRRPRRRPRIGPRRSDRIELQDNTDRVPEGQRSCAVCRAIMETVVREDLWFRRDSIVIDECPAHGTWFDRGELEVLLDRAEDRQSNFNTSKSRQAFNEGFDQGAHDGRRFD